MTNPNPALIAFNYLSSPDFEDFISSIFGPASYDKDEKAAIAEVVDYLTTLPDFGGNISTSPDISEYNNYDELFADCEGSPTFYFDADESNLFVNEMLDEARKALNPKRKWGWDDPGTLYLHNDPKSAEELESRCREAETFRAFAEQIYDVARKQINAKLVETLLDKIIKEDKKANEVRQAAETARIAAGIMNSHEVSEEIGKLVDVTSPKRKIRVLMSPAANDNGIYLQADTWQNGGNEDLVDSVEKILAHGGFACGPVEPDYFSRVWSIVVVQVIGKPPVSLDRQKLLDLLDGKIAIAEWATYIQDSKK